VGKSTALILLVKELLERGVHPKSVFYLSCDAIADYRELAEVLRMYLKVRRAEGISSSYILLDEVTYPREWFRAVKSMIINICPLARICNTDMSIATLDTSRRLRAIRRTRPLNPILST